MHGVTCPLCGGPVVGGELGVELHGEPVHSWCLVNPELDRLRREFRALKLATRAVRDQGQWLREMSCKGHDQLAQALAEWPLRRVALDHLLRSHLGQIVSPKGIAIEDDESLN